MQQTETYKFNLIEPSDTFSPDPLNENMEKVEAALATKTDADTTDALKQRVQVLELHKMAAGYYTGTGGTQTIEIGFTPKAVITDPTNYGLIKPHLCVEGYPHEVMEIVPGGFKVSHNAGNLKDPGICTTLNQNGVKFRYVALC